MNMKTKLFLLLVLISVGFSSCDIIGESDSTPQILIFPRLLVYKTDTLNKVDTLDIYLTSTDGELLLDTITVGDTVLMPITFNGVTNRITAFYLVQSTDNLTSIVLPSKSTMDSLFLPSSNYDEGKFVANGTYTYLYFPFRYIAKKPSKDAKLTITATSDAVFKDFSGTNTKSFVLKTPIIEAK